MRDAEPKAKVFISCGQHSDEERAIAREIESSLQRLQTDYLDIYYMHAPDYETPIEESLEAMGRLVQEGKVRYVGCSNLEAWELMKAMGFSRERVL